MSHEETNPWAFLKSDNPRPLTEQEVRDVFLDHIRNMVDYWEVNTNRATVREKLQGLAFSMLVLLDGETLLPGFSVTPCPHESDTEYHQEKGENWFPDDVDIAGSLHEEFFNHE